MKYRIVEIEYEDLHKEYQCERTGFFRRNTWRIMKKPFGQI